MKVGLMGLGELTSDLNLLSIDMGGQPATEFREMTELIGTQVIPQLP